MHFHPILYQDVLLPLHNRSVQVLLAGVEQNPEIFFRSTDGSIKALYNRNNSYPIQRIDTKSETVLCCVIDHFIPRYQTWTRPVMFEEPRCPQMLSTRSRILRMLQGDGDGILGDCDGILGDGDGILGDGYGILGDGDGIFGDGDGILGDGDGQCP